MKDKDMTIRLWQMSKFQEASENNHVSAPNKKRGQWSPDGWIVNTFWNGKKANDGLAEMRRLVREFPQFFESEYVSVLKETYGNAFYHGNSARLEAKRIKPEYRNAWTLKVASEIAVAEAMLERRKK